MKKFYTLFVAAFCCTSIYSQVIFQSNFSNWTSNVPDGWVGVKTNFAPDSIIQINIGSQYGTSSVRLVNTTTTHKRFTTQPYSVAEGDTFEIRFWAKGKGDVRSGIFDNNLGTGNFGYHYNSYLNINDSNWNMYTQQIIADTTWNAAEFIFSVKATDAASGHIQLDSAAIMYAASLPPQTLTITAIQGGVSTSPYVNQTVTTKGVVTAYATYKHPTDPNKDYRSYFLQNGDSAWSGIWVSDTVNYINVASGDTVAITAQVEEFFGYTRLKNITSFQKSVGLSQPVPMMVSTLDASDEKYEGVLVEVNNAIVVDTTGITFGNFAVNDGTDTLLVDDIMYGPSNGPFLNDVLNLKGCMFYSFSKRYLLPRKPSDFTWLNSIEEENNSLQFSVYPNPSDGEFNLKISYPIAIGFENLKMGKIKIYNVLGEEVYSQQLSTVN